MLLWLRSYKERKKDVSFDFCFVFNSCGLHPQDAVKVTNVKDEGKKELAASYCLLPPPPKNGAAVIPSCSAVAPHHDYCIRSSPGEGY